MVQRYSIKRFIFLFVLYEFFFFLLIGLMPIKKFIDVNAGFTGGITFLAGKILSLFHIPTHVSGSILYCQNVSLDILFGCNGLEAYFIFLGAVLAFPVTWRNRLGAAILGFLVIQSINIFRIVALALCGLYTPKIFEIVHLYVAQGFIIAVALITFFLWVRKVV